MNYKCYPQLLQASHCVSHRWKSCVIRFFFASTVPFRRDSIITWSEPDFTMTKRKRGAKRRVRRRRYYGVGQIYFATSCCFDTVHVSVLRKSFFGLCCGLLEQLLVIFPPLLMCRLCTISLKPMPLATFSLLFPLLPDRDLIYPATVSMLEPLEVIL